MRERRVRASGPKKRADVGHPPASSSRRFQMKSGGWSNKAFMLARALLPYDVDPETFTHDDLSQLVRTIERSAETIGIELTAKTVRNEMEWILWDRDKWRHVSDDRHERAA